MALTHLVHIVIYRVAELFGRRLDLIGSERGALFSFVLRFRRRFGGGGLRAAACREQGEHQRKREQEYQYFFHFVIPLFSVFYRSTL